jgi:hypothetical protein
MIRLHAAAPTVGSTVCRARCSARFLRLLATIGFPLDGDDLGVMNEHDRSGRTVQAALGRPRPLENERLVVISVSARLVATVASKTAVASVQTG